jgi:PAS domain S-box-containing protein
MLRSQGLKKISSLIVVAIGLIALLGWTLGSNWFTRTLPGLIAMKANTALCFVLLGLAIYFSQHPNLRVRQVSKLFVGIAVLIASLSLVEIIFRLNLHIDELLVVDTLDPNSTSAPGRMAELSAISFTLLGIAVFWATLKEQWRQILVLVVLAISLSGFMSYAFSSVYGTGLYSFTGMAINTAFSFALLCIGQVGDFSKSGWMSVILSRSQIGANTRTLLFTAIFAPFLLGWIAFAAENAGWIESGFAQLAYSISVMFLLSLVVITNAQKLYDSETVRQTLETDVYEARQQLFALVDYSPLAITIKTAGGVYELVNDHFEELVNKPRAQILGSQAANLFAAHTLDSVMQSDKKVLEAKAAVISEINTEIAGKPRTYLTTNFPLLNPAGDVQSIAGIWTDISEQKALSDALRLANQALRESEERFTKAFHLSPVGVSLTRMADGRFVDLNLAASEIFGIPREEVVGKTSLELGILSPEAREQVTALIREKGLVRNIELPVLNRKLGPRDLLYSVESVNIGNEPCFLTVMVDITERKKAEEQLHKSNVDLERSNKELEQFAYVASHDLQEPLRMVSSYMQLLEGRYRDKLDKDAQEFIDFAVDGAVRMQRLIQDLLAFSRVGTRGSSPELVDSNSALEEALGNLKLRIDETKAEIKAVWLPPVMVDRHQFVLVFQNLSPMRSSLEAKRLQRYAST